jgi:hypothetical protein
MGMKAQALIWATYNAYQAGVIGLEAVQYIQAEVMKYEEAKRQPPANEG